MGSVPAALASALMPDTPAFVAERYATLAERARTRSFGLLSDDVVILDTETTGLSAQENELIEISAARLEGGAIAERFDTFVHPTGPIPPEIMELTHITNADVAHAPSARDAVAALADFVGGRPVVAHNATFDRTFIEHVPGGVAVSDLWIDSLALSRIALPRLASHKLASMAELFGCASVSHRACDDVDALAGLWPILLTALSDLPEGLVRALADMHPEVAWPYRPLFSYLAEEGVSAAPFSLAAARARVLEADASPQHVDVDELPALKVPTRDEIERAFAPGGLVAAMYPEYEPRPEQVAMALEVRDALATGTHRVVEAGTGVGKSVAYLVPLALTAKRNNVTVGVATKSNNLADQLMFHELPRLARELDGGLGYTALKGYDHYPCLRKLERLRRSTAEIKTNRDPADTLTAIAVIYAYVCQSPEGDLDALGIRWRSVDRSSLTTGSRECARRLCPFFPDKCLVHGARRRAARADVVVTNHSLLFRNVQADGKILPPIRIWAVDEAHGIEAEARRQWAVEVSAEEVRTLFERLGNDKTGVVGRLLSEVAQSDAATLFMGLLAKANASVQRASLVMADVFDRTRDVARAARERGYDSANVWVSPELRASGAWAEPSRRSVPSGRSGLSTSRTPSGASRRCSPASSSCSRARTSTTCTLSTSISACARAARRSRRSASTSGRCLPSAGIPRCGALSSPRPRSRWQMTSSTSTMPSVWTCSSRENRARSISTRVMTSTATWRWWWRATCPIPAIATRTLRRLSACWWTCTAPWEDRCSRFSPTGAIWRTSTSAWSPPSRATG